MNAVGKYIIPNKAIAMPKYNIFVMLNIDKPTPKATDIAVNAQKANIVFMFIFIKPRLRHTRPNK